ncbi:hypothetical protein [Cryptosporangium sp. NPDC048952]|uniref:hypothetical protein n=1 Tax=Cryptosporangium sp. NPDC048952 TaxID=3363961 RepID=UPI0037136463
MHGGDDPAPAVFQAVIVDSNSSRIARYRDAADRRKVYVRSTGQHEEKLAEIYGPLSEATNSVLQSFDVTSLDTVRDVLSQLADVSRTFIGSEKPPPES